jgi:hypothetical protein
LPGEKENLRVAYTRRAATWRVSSDFPLALTVAAALTVAIDRQVDPSYVALTVVLTDLVDRPPVWSR